MSSRRRRAASSCWSSAPRRGRRRRSGRSRRSADGPDGADVGQGDAAAVAAGETGRPKREVYARGAQASWQRERAMARPRGEDRRAQSRRALSARTPSDSRCWLLILKGYWPLPVATGRLAARSTSSCAAGARSWPWRSRRGRRWERPPRPSRRRSFAGSAWRSPASGAERGSTTAIIFRCDAMLVAPRRWPRHIVSAATLD